MEEGCGIVLWVKFLEMHCVCLALFCLACGMGEYIHGQERENTGMYNEKSLGALEPATTSSMQVGRS